MTTSKKGFTIQCKNPNCPGGRIETTMEGDSGYSNWTVMDNGFIEFKCHGCGKFASTDEYKKPNNPDNFEVRCNSCESTGWEPHIQDVESDELTTRIICTQCQNFQEQT